MLVHELGARMAERGRGGIIVMSSLAAETGAANVALYSATKAFDLVLAEGLWYELRDRGVDVDRDPSRFDADAGVAVDATGKR